MFKKVLITITCRNPNEILIENLENLYYNAFFNWKFYLNYYKDLRDFGLKSEKAALWHWKQYGKKSGRISNNCKYKIVCVDSDSNNKDTYKIIEKSFPEVEILYAKNKNYEYGAYKYAYNKYPNYDIYVCLQDTFLIKRSLNLNLINDNTCYFYHANHSGFFSDMDTKNFGKNVLKSSDLKYKDIIDTNFLFSEYNSFIVSNNVLKDLFKTFVIPPSNKCEAACYERLFGLYFILKNIKILNLVGLIEKKFRYRG